MDKRQQIWEGWENYDWPGLKKRGVEIGTQNIIRSLKGIDSFEKFQSIKQEDCVLSIYINTEVILGNCVNNDGGVRAQWAGHEQGNSKTV